MVYNQFISTLKRTSVFIMLMFFLFGCASYNERIAPYYNAISAGDLQGAKKSLEKNALLKKPRNKLLYDMEMGRLAHLQGDYLLSNQYLNQADLLIEDGLKSAGDVAVGLVLNSMSQNYKGEEFEIFMLHYYKALNYMYLGQIQEAVVEARRISLQNYQQADKYGDKTTRYSKDAFSLILQGLIYEYDRDYNNAFISYRNAVEVYLSSKTGLYYGVSMPKTLQHDVMRMAYLLGFTSELYELEKTFNTTFEHESNGQAKDLVIFWENGLAPIKQQEDVLFTLVKGESGALFFTNALGIMIPVDLGIAGGTSLNDIHSVNIAYPKYLSIMKPYYMAKAKVNEQKSYSFEQVQDIDNLAVSTLKERSAKELGKILTRMAVKKSAEYSLKAAARNQASKGENNAVLEGLGFGVQVYNLLSEKADTRNWQTLPSEISYLRIPLEQQENKIKIELYNHQTGKKEFEKEFSQSNNLQFYNFATMK
ncbi:COG3014 family protein [Myroides sp. LJL119]